MTTTKRTTVPTAMAAFARERWRLISVVLVLAGIAAAVIIVVVRTHRHDRQLPPPRAREYTDYQACLLTGESGLADPAARPIWAGMQDASQHTHTKVSYLAVTGPQTLGNTLPYATTLVQRQCTVILAAGANPTDTITQSAADHPQIHYIVIGNTAQAGNISAVPTGTDQQITDGVSALVQQLTRA